MDTIFYKLRKTNLDKENFTEKISPYESIYIYGAGNTGYYIYKYLCESGLKSKVKAFLQSKVSCKDVSIDGNVVPLRAASSEIVGRNDAVIIAVTARYRNEITLSCKQHGFQNLFPIKEFDDPGYDYYSKIPESQYPAEDAYLFQKVTGEKLEWKNLKGFDEKIQWIKLYGYTSLMTKLADKYVVREWVAERIGKEYLIPLLGVWDSFDEIDFGSLPKEFALKCNHGSGFNLIVHNKDEINFKNERVKFDGWMSENYAFNSFEMQYRDIPRKIIAEKYIQQNDDDLVDYKVHCFNGKPEIIQVIGNRNLQNHTAREAFFDLNWNRNMLMYNTYDQYSVAPEKPAQLLNMLDIARCLSSDFNYSRVDFYIVNGRIFFGEMTFTPASGFGKWKTGGRKADLLVGSWIDI